MALFKDLRSYILEDDFKITFINNKVNIVNYDSIDHFDSNKVIIRSEKQSVTVKGDKLFVSKLLNDEVLIEGQITNIEFR